MEIATNISWKQLAVNNPLWENLKHIPSYGLQPVRLFQEYDRGNLRSDVIAGLTIAVILLPQAIAFALIAELPPQMGLYAAILGAIIGALWGSSHQIHTGPTNAISLLVLSTLTTTFVAGSAEFIIAAGMLALMVGVFQLVMGLARLGMVVNFVSHSVIVGFSSGAAILIAVNQIRRLLGLEFSSHNMLETLQGVATNLLYTHWQTAALGVGTIILISALKKWAAKLPGPLIAMIVASGVVYLLGLDKQGVDVIGPLPASLPPLAKLPFFDLDLIARLSTGALAVGAIGLVETTAIARSIAAQTGQRLHSNQEFVGQGLANIAAGLFSGYPCAGSFSRSAVNFKAGAKTPVSAIFSGAFVLVALFTVAPLAAFLPRTALAGVLIVTAYGMIDKAEIGRIWQGSRGDALIMVVTFAGTLFLHIEFAVLAGIFLSFVVYIMKTSVPRVYPVLPDRNFKHFIQQEPDQPSCPQLGIIKISGDLYFGAVTHVEETIRHHLTQHPNQRFLLLRMQGANHIDFSGIHMLEAVRRMCRERGGDLYLMKIQKPVLAFMHATDFYEELGADHFLDEDQAIDYLFYKIIDPAVCIYECNTRAFAECQNLPQRSYESQIPLYAEGTPDEVANISAQDLWHQLYQGQNGRVVIDVREPREYRAGHIQQAQLMPLPAILTDLLTLTDNEEVVLVCRSGRRSLRAAQILKNRGHQNVTILQGGMLAWEAAGLLAVVDI